MALTPAILPLDEAIGEIAQACAAAPEGGTARPFAFIVGAGISFPPVPLAGKIESECREIAEKRGVKPPPGIPSAMERYSHWFGRAYSQPILRQKFLESLIEGKEISLANFRLAHLLRAKCVASMVITPNFDNFLSRALTTFGEDTFRVCDHPKTVDRISHRRPEIQIVHVHGNHWSYDQANLSGELEERALPSATTTSSMAQLLDAIFRELSPIVVGYSGWEGDVIMKALLRRNSEAYAYKSYWFCHRRTDLDALPAWLKSRQDFVFILPPEPQPTDRPTSTESTTRASGLSAATLTERAPAPRLEPASAPAPAAESGERTDQIMASTVFDRLIVALGAETPPLFRDPLEFFAQRLEASVPKEMTLPGKGGVAYQFGETIEKIRRAQQSLFAAEKTSGKAQEAETLLAEVRDAIRGSRYEDALKTASRISVDDLGETGRRGLVDSLSLAVRNVDPKADYTLPAVDLLIGLADALSKSSPAPELDLILAEAMHGKAFAFWTAARFENAIAVYEEIVTRFEANPSASLQEQVAKALVNKALSLSSLNRGDKAILVYDEVVRRFGSSTDEKAQEAVARALLIKGVILGETNRSEESVVVYDDIIRRFASSTVIPVQEEVAKGLVNKGIALEALNRREAAIDAYQEVVRLCGASTAETLQEPVARALLHKGSALGALSRDTDALAAYDEIVRRFGDSSIVELQVDVAWALYNKAFLLWSRTPGPEPLAIYDELVRRFGDSSAPAVQEPVAWALYNKGFGLENINRGADAISAYDEMVRRFADSTLTSIQELLAWALYNKGFTLAKMNRPDDAIPVYDELIRRLGNSTVDAVLEPVSRALLNKASYFANLNRRTEALALNEEIARRFANSTSATIRERVASALASKADILVSLNQQTEAIRVLEDLIQNYGSSPEPNLVDVVEKAKEKKNSLALGQSSGPA
jgi:tetratricopeptide (TPR) repeat protein